MEPLLRLKSNKISNSADSVNIVSTRALVKLIRDNGSLNGLLTMYGENNNNNIQIQEFFNRQQFIYANNNQNLVANLKPIYEKWSCTICESNKKSKNKKTKCLKILIFDFGLKHNIVHKIFKHGKLLGFGIQIDVVPYYYLTKKHLLTNIIKKNKYNGIILSNGPGNPKTFIESNEQEGLIDNIKEIALKDKIPILGICLGHQILGIVLANGNTTNLKFGHRGMLGNILVCTYQYFLRVRLSRLQLN